MTPISQLCVLQAHREKAEYSDLGVTDRTIGPVVHWWVLALVLSFPDETSLELRISTF